MEELLVYISTQVFVEFIGANTIALYRKLTGDKRKYSIIKKNTAHYLKIWVGAIVSGILIILFVRIVDNRW